MGDDIGQLTALAIDPALRGRASAAVQHGGDQVLDKVEVAVLGQYRSDVINQRADHLRGRRRATISTDEITLESRPAGSPAREPE